MNIGLPTSQPSRWLGLLLWASMPGAYAQWSFEVEGIRRFHLRAVEPAVELNVEAQDDRRTNRGSPLNRSYAFVEPVVSVDLHGSVYHPNLFEFRFKPELGLSTQVLRQDPPGGVRWSEKILQRYNLRVNLLREKPFATSFFAERGYTYRDLDFFSRARIDSLRYGGSSGYSAGRLPFTLAAHHMEEVVGGDVRSAMELSGNTLSFNASRTEHKKHKTDFSYVLNTYDRLQANAPATSGTSHHANLWDSITAGRDDWVTLNSMGLFNQINGNASHTRSLILREMLMLQFRPNLAGDANYGFGKSRSENVESRSHDGGVAIQHQLYKSLASRFSVLGESSEAHGGGTSLTTRRVGAHVQENYTKKLPGQSLLRLDASCRGDLNQRKTAGQVLHISNEVLTLSDRQPVFLAQPNVIAVGRVADTLGLPYLETLDYVLLPHTAIMEIRRVPGGNIPEGGKVFVSYTAAVPPSDDYSTLAQSYQVRLDLFQGLLGLYGRLNKIEQYGGKSVVLRNLNGRALGAEFNWRGVGFGAERDREDSNLSPFHTTRIFQSLTYDAGMGSLFGLHAEQSRTTYPDTGRKRERRSFIGRYQQSFASSFASLLEGGWQRERGLGFDQDRIAVRASLKYAYGKLYLNLSYDFEDDNLLGELHRRHHVQLQIKRLL